LLDKRKCILLLGASEDQLFIIKSAKELELETAVIDRNKCTPGLSCATYSAPIDFSDTEKVIEYVKELMNMGVNICGVCTMGSDIPHIVSKIADTFGWIGPSEYTGRLATNKYEMKLCFKENGISVPRFALVKSAEDVLFYWKSWNCSKVIIKPTDRAGSRGVCIIERKQDVEISYRHALANSQIGQVILEEFIEGRQISTESLIFEGKVCTPGFADRVYDGMYVYWPQIMENGAWVPTDLSDEKKYEVVMLIERAARALGIKKGVAKGDVVMHPYKGATMIEMAARLSGGDFSESLVPLGSGINYVKTALKIAIGEEPDLEELEPKWEKVVANRYFFLPTGYLQDVQGLEECRSLAEVNKLVISYHIGDYVPEIRSHGQRVGVMIITGENRKEVQNLIDYVYRKVQFKINDKWYSGLPRNAC